MGKRTRAALALAEAQAAESTPAFLQLQDKDEGLDAIFTKTFAVCPPLSAALRLDTDCEDSR